MNRVYCLILILFVSSVGSLTAQSLVDNQYKLLHTQLQLSDAYTPLPQYVSALIDSAESYALSGDYDFALIFLEQARDDLSAATMKKKMHSVDYEKPTFSYYAQSGIDFNRQEFELGFDQSDSLLLEQVDKPFFGVGIRYNSLDGQLELENKLRYDKENLESELSMRNRWQKVPWILEGYSGYVFDRNFLTHSLGYHELYSRWAFSYHGAITDFYFREDARYKRYFEASPDIPDFFRNTLSADLAYQLNYIHALHLSYILDYNQSLRTQNNDYSENSVSLEYAGSRFKMLKINLPLRAESKKFSYVLNDSLLNNTALTLSLEPEIDYQITSSLSLGLKYQIDKKEFKLKTEQDPDYTFMQILPEISFIFSEAYRLSLGYLFENKNHKLQTDLDEIYIKEQNYQAQGLSLNFDITQSSGLFLSLDASYTRRRYPDAIVADNFSIYADRNIFSILSIVQWPIMDNLSLNIIAAFDNDKDLDSDFNDSRSSYYTADLKYEF